MQKYKVDNAIILAAGLSSRFAPISYEYPKALIDVKGEVLIERQIKQLIEAGIDEVIIVVGYMKEKFEYLKEKYGVILVENKEFLIKNNNSSIYSVKDYLRNSYICSSDNYFISNPFEAEVDESYYSAVFVDGNTKEWCIKENNGYIKDVVIGGCDSWIMLGHVFWSKEFSKQYLSILEMEYNDLKTFDKLWETIYIEHIDELNMKVRKYPSSYIFEFDTLDELRMFDNSYISDTRSVILKDLVKKLQCSESMVKEVEVFKDENNIVAGFTFTLDKRFKYFYDTKILEEIK